MVRGGTDRSPTAAVAIGYLGSYAALRIATTWMIGSRGLRQRQLWKQLPLIPVWDAVAVSIWLVSFLRNSIRWRGADYNIREGQLVPVTAVPTTAAAVTGRLGN